MLVKEMLGRSDRPFSIADVMQRCAEKKLTLSEAAITQVSALGALVHGLHVAPHAGMHTGPGA